MLHYEAFEKGPEMIHPHLRGQETCVIVRPVKVIYSTVIEMRFFFKSSGQGQFSQNCCFSLTHIVPQTLLTERILGFLITSTLIT